MSTNLARRCATAADTGHANRVFLARHAKAQRLPRILPREVVCNELLMNFCRRLIAPDPARRFISAEAADLVKEEGAAAFHRQLIKGDLANEYDNEIRLWLEELEDFE